MHMLDNPIITYINFILLKHDIVAFVTNSEYKKKIKIMYIYHTKNILSNTSTLNLQLCIIKCSLKIKIITFNVNSFQNHCMFI